MRSTMAEGSGEGTTPTVPLSRRPNSHFFKEAEVGCFVPERNQPLCQAYGIDDHLNTSVTSAGCQAEPQVAAMREISTKVKQMADAEQPNPARYPKA